MYPAKQARLLQLWDELGILHDKDKQEFGSVLRIIGLEVDPNAMTVTMDIDAWNELTQLINIFTVTGKKCTLAHFQSRELGIQCLPTSEAWPISRILQNSWKKSRLSHYQSQY